MFLKIKTSLLFLIVDVGIEPLFVVIVIVDENGRLSNILQIAVGFIMTVDG